MNYVIFIYIKLMIIDDKIKSTFSVRLPKKICQVPNKFSRI